MSDIKRKMKRLREPFDAKVYAIPYAGDLFEKQAQKLIDLAIAERDKNILDMIKEKSDIIPEIYYLRMVEIIKTNSKK